MQQNMYQILYNTNNEAKKKKKKFFITIMTMRKIIQTITVNRIKSKKKAKSEN